MGKLESQQLTHSDMIYGLLAPDGSKGSGFCWERPKRVRSTLDTSHGTFKMDGLKGGIKGCFGWGLFGLIGGKI